MFTPRYKILFTSLFTFKHKFYLYTLYRHIKYSIVVCRLLFINIFRTFHNPLTLIWYTDEIILLIFIVQSLAVKKRVLVLRLGDVVSATLHFRVAYKRISVSTYI